jgi:hypothetical protein
MPRGLPDYYNPATAVSGQLMNLGATVAAAMGKAPIDNLGALYWFDNFRDGVAAWSVSSSGAWVLPFAEVGFAEIPPVCVMLGPLTLPNSGSAQMVHQAYLPGASRLGLEIGLVLNSTLSDFDMRLYYDTGTYNYYGRVYYSSSAKSLSIYDPSGAQLLDTLVVPGGAISWMPVKLVIDPLAAAYVRLVLGQTRYDLSAYSLSHDASFMPGACEIILIASIGVSSVKYARLGHVYLTTDEA